MADMTATAQPRRRARALAPEPAPPSAKVNWERYGVLVVVALQTAGAIWFFATEANRIATLEATTKPIAEGQLQRIDERTVGMANDIADLKRWLLPPARR